MVPSLPIFKGCQGDPYPYKIGKGILQDFFTFPTLDEGFTYGRCSDMVPSLPIFKGCQGDPYPYKINSEIIQIFSFCRGSKPGQVLRCTSRFQKSTDLQGWSERSAPFQDQLRNPLDFLNFIGDPGLGKYSDALLGLRSPQIFKDGQSDPHPFKINSEILYIFSILSGIQAWASTQVHF